MGFATIFQQVKDKEGELKAAEQKLHDEFERLRRQNSEEKRQLDDKKRQLVRLCRPHPSHLSYPPLKFGHMICM